jgi:hypothetical protein
VSQHAEWSWHERALGRIGHRAAELLIIAVGITIVIGLRPLPGALMLTVPLAVVLLVIVAWLAMRRHDRRLCEQCMAAMPLNPAEEASRYRRRFWTAHTAFDRRFLVPYLVVLIGSNFATTPVGKIGWAIVQSSMVYLIASHATHRRLQPWCPWCSDGGGGEHVEETPPVLPRDDHQPV